MGWGDEIMVTGIVREMRKADPRPVAVLGKNDKPRWHPIWNGNPHLATPDDVAAGMDVQVLKNCPGHRPYVDTHSPARWLYTDWKCVPGELYVPRRPKADYVVIEPHIKPNASPNKQWGWTRWQRLVELLPAVRWVQLGPPGTKVLDGVAHIATATFPDACTALSGAAAYVGPEGGLHHAAAALDLPAVVIFGGMVSPRNTGYDTHINLADAGPESPCGSRLPCDHCAAAFDAITPELVADKLEEIL